jgi:dihydrofolate reductase
MPELKLDITMSLDGFVAGPRPSLENPLGEGGEGLHEWAFGLKAWREPHGLEGGEDNADSKMVQETTSSNGAYIMGRRMFSGGQGSWEDDPNADGWWGDTPPFGVPVFVLTHHAREPLVKEGGTTFHFVTEGVETALDLAREAAGDRDVAIGGGADVAQQYLRAGLLDRMQIHVAPLLLGDGVRLFSGDAIELEQTDVAYSPAATHITYRREEAR